MLTGYKRFYKGAVADEVYTKLGASDYAAEIAQIRASGADSVYSSSCRAAWGSPSSSNTRRPASTSRSWAPPSPSTRASCRPSARRRSA